MIIHFAMDIRVLSQNGAATAIAGFGGRAKMDHAANLAIPTRNTDHVALTEDGQNRLDGTILGNFHLVGAGMCDDAWSPRYVSHP